VAKPIAVLISDVHYSLNTLELADAAFRQAINKASDLRVPLIDCGDLTNDKAIMRAEVCNRLIDTMLYAKHSGVNVTLLVGNHSLCNEKGAEHALHFLRPYVYQIIQEPYRTDLAYFIPYTSDAQLLENIVKKVETGSLLIMHTGVQSANMGHYIKDTSSLPKEVFANYRVISGHYHARQDIKCGRPRKGAVGLFSYVGNPYTLTFGEANDPEKGFQILMDDGTLEFVPTNLRKHVVLEFDLPFENFNNPVQNEGYSAQDRLWVKVRGSTSELAALKKDKLAKILGVADFKLDKIPTDAVKLNEVKLSKMTGEQVFDAVIDAQQDDKPHKEYLKKLWRDLV